MRILIGMVVAGLGYAALSPTTRAAVLGFFEGLLTWFQ